jgi:hypothetical protein
VTAGKIAFVPFGKHLFSLNERPKNADSSSAFAADMREPQEIGRKNSAYYDVRCMTTKRDWGWAVGGVCSSSLDWDFCGPHEPLSSTMFRFTTKDLPGCTHGKRSVAALFVRCLDCCSLLPDFVGRQKEEMIADVDSTRGI